MGYRLEKIPENKGFFVNICMSNQALKIWHAYSSPSPIANRVKAYMQKCSP